MEKVPGHVIRGELPRGYATTDSEREQMAFTFVDTLAALHAVDQDAVGLCDYGRPAGFMERQVRRWPGQWEASRTHAVAEIDELARRLTTGVTGQARSQNVHGTYLTDHFAYTPNDPARLTAGSHR